MEATIDKTFVMRVASFMELWANKLNNNKHFEVKTNPCSTLSHFGTICEVNDGYEKVRFFFDSNRVEVYHPHRINDLERALLEIEHCAFY